MSSTSPCVSFCYKLHTKLLESIHFYTSKVYIMYALRSFGQVVKDFNPGLAISLCHTSLQRARDLFYALWIPDLFMRRCEGDGMWSLMCPNECPGLQDCWGEKFDKLYERWVSKI